jgi:UDP-glucose 4-epimerase
VKITILGGFGFIGAALAARCIEEGHEVTVFSRADRDGTRLANYAGRYRFVGGDFALVDEVLPAIKGADVVVHLISGTVPGSSINHPTYDVEVNVLPSLQLFQACVEHSVGKVIFISSGGTVYGVANERPSKESDCCSPIVPYAVSKEMIEKYLAVFAHHHKLDYTVLRLANPYGPGQLARSGQGVIAAWMQRLKLGETVEIWGDGNVVRDYIYIDDAVSAILLAMSKRASRRIFNVGCGVGYSLNQLHEIMERSLGIDLPVVYKPGRAADVPINVLDVREIKQALGWSPMTSIEDGLRQTWVEFPNA